MTPSIRFSASFILASIVLALFLLSTSAAVTSNKDEKQAEYLAERDLQRSYPAKGKGTLPPWKQGKPHADKQRLKPGGNLGLVIQRSRAPTIAPKKSAAMSQSSPTKLPFGQNALETPKDSKVVYSNAQKNLGSLANQVASAQSPFKFCSVNVDYSTSLPCQVLFPNPTRNAFITPVVLPFANPANGFQQCWGAKPAPWQCGVTKNALGDTYGNYPNAYVGSYIEFPSGYLSALQADTRSTAARDAITAVMEEFVYNVVTNMLGLGTSMNARCGFPNSMVFGCTSTSARKNNPQLNFGVAPDGRVRLLIIFMVDWNVIISRGRITSFSQYESTVQGFFSTRNLAPLWDAALRSKGAGSSQFLKGGSRRALEGEEEGGQEGGEKEGSLRKLPASKGAPKVTKTGVVKVVAVGGTK